MITHEQEELLNEQGVGAVTSVVDLVVFQGVPIASVTQSVLTQWTSIRDRLFARKIIGLLNEFEDANLVLLGQAIENLRNEHGAEYFDEVFFSSVEAANSSEMARILSKAIVAVSEERIPLDHFWIIAQALKSLTIQDLSLLALSNKKHISVFPNDSQQRLGSVGISYFATFYGGGRIEWHRETLVSFLKVITGQDTFEIAEPEGAQPEW